MKSLQKHSFFTRKRLFIVFALCAAWPLKAHNNLFFPGDSFFSSELTAKVSRLKDNKPWLITYKRHYKTTMPCGFAGYRSLEIHNITEDLKRNLAKIFTNRKKETQKDQFPLFIYNKNFDLNNFHLCLRYNENWQKETVELGFEHSVYEGINKNHDLAVQDWRQSIKVPPLQTTGHRPKSKNEKKHKEMSHIIKADANKIMFVILESPDIESYALKKPNVSFYTVSVDEGIKRYSYDEERCLTEDKSLHNSE